MMGHGKTVAIQVRTPSFAIVTLACAMLAGWGWGTAPLTNSRDESIQLSGNAL